MMNSRISLLASLLLFTPFASQAQQRVGLTPIATVVPQFGTPPSFGIETGITCPTPSLNSSGFAADADNWASHPDTTGGRTGYGNFGVLGGINIPFGGSLSRFCADYAAQKNKIQALNRQAQELSNANFSSPHAPVSLLARLMLVLRHSLMLFLFIRNARILLPSVKRRSSWIQPHLLLPQLPISPRLRL